MPVEDVTRSWADFLLEDGALTNILAILRDSSPDYAKRLEGHLASTKALLAESEDREKRARAEAYRECAEIAESRQFSSDGFRVELSPVFDVINLQASEIAKRIRDLAAKSEAEEKVR